MYDNAKEMAEDLALETQRANEWEAKYTELLAEHVQLLGEYGKIVRCKDCKFSRPSCIKGRLICTNNTLPGDLKDEDYCSKGMRK